MKYGPDNHHPRCTCHKCHPPVARTPAPPPAQAKMFAERRPSAPAARPPAPAATPPPPVQYLPDVDDRGSAVRITAATARRYTAASNAAGRDARAARLLALRAQHVPLDEAIARVDAEFGGGQA